MRGRKERRFHKTRSGAPLFFKGPSFSQFFLMPATAPASLLFRIPLLVLGMAAAASGIAAVTTAGLGTTPISTLPLAVAEIFGMTFGTGTFIVNVGFVLGQILLLRRHFPLPNLLQIPVVLLFSVFIDGAMALFGKLALPDAYAAHLGLSLFGNLLMAVGIVMQIRSKTLVQPGEGIVLAASFVLRRPFGTLKIANDVSLVAASALLAWTTLGHTVAIREGTLVSAVLVGLLVKAIERLLGSGRKAEDEGKPALERE